MVYLLCIIPFLLATTVLADYDIDNSDTSVIYTFPPTGSGWQTYSVTTGQLQLEFSNSTGNYTVVLDASHCYDQNYAQGYCGTSDNCLVQIPFTGSGITMYVFNAGLTGIAASFSIDDGKAVSNTTQSPSPPTYQSNLAMYDIQGLTSGNHTMVMTVLDWGGSKTYMKFDYAHVNETLVEALTTTSSTLSQTSTSASQTSSQTPSQTSAGNSSTKINLGGIIGGTLAGIVLLAGILTGFFCLRKKRRALLPHQETFSPVQTSHVDAFTTEYPSNLAPPRTHVVSQQKQTSTSVGISPLTRSAILRDALVLGSSPSSEPTQSTSSQSIRSGMSPPTPPVLQPLRGEMFSVDTEASDLNINNISRPSVADAESPFMDHPRPSRFNLTVDQLNVIDRLRADNLPAETISRVIEGFVLSHPRVDEDGTGRSIISASAPPPSYHR